MLTTRHIHNDLPSRNTTVKNRAIYNKNHDLLLEIQADLVNGVLRTEIFEKLKNKMYENSPERDIKERQLNYYIQTAQEMLKADRIEKQEVLKDLLFSQYMQQYRDAVLVGNTLTAKSVLDSIAKIFLPNDKSTNVQVNAGDSGITIKFGFSEDE